MIQRSFASHACNMQHASRCHSVFAWLHMHAALSKRAFLCSCTHENAVRCKLRFFSRIIACAAAADGRIQRKKTGAGKSTHELLTRPIQQKSQQSVKGLHMLRAGRKLWRKRSTHRRQGKVTMGAGISYILTTWVIHVFCSAEPLTTTHGGSIVILRRENLSESTLVSQVNTPRPPSLSDCPHKETPHQQCWCIYVSLFSTTINLRTDPPKRMSGAGGRWVCEVHCPIVRPEVRMSWQAHVMAGYTPRRSSRHCSRKKRIHPTLTFSCDTGNRLCEESSSPRVMVLSFFWTREFLNTRTKSDSRVRLRDSIDARSSWSRPAPQHRV